ncbi:uracil-DNA glycosylase family protein [Gimesia aquarii]|uniref:Type-4 uracil-DNA glycosylase n=1 Tax=Gimesia aquarii TaxID=2527964 RepID=A0A517WZB8_9PLAN|nr:uracil-DNA glycosylase [Gimesia aquarii]QDU10602.1 Uracil DNA glycosylase superfamily protein [Gimesia aquarii]
MNDNKNNHSQTRAARQLIESWQRSGVKHIKRVVPVMPEKTVVEESLQVNPSGAKPRTSSKELQSSANQGVLFRENDPSPINTVIETEEPRKEMSVTRTTKSKLKKADRQAELNIIADQVAQCQKCPELASTRTQTVFGVGNPAAKIMFIGEAPGADEDKQGEPFVGRAGKLLDKIIEACQLKRSDIYIANILRCRPPGNRNPSDTEAANCRGFLDAQIEIVDPDYIVCWGSVAAKNLLRSELPIGKMRGRFYEYGRARVICTYHPSYLLRNPSAKKNVWEDMIDLFQDMGIDLKAQS